MECVAGSGCGKRAKGDVVDSVWSGQGKSTRKGSITVNAALLDKTWADAKKMGRLPFIDVDISAPPTVPRPRGWVIIPGPVFQILKHRLTPEEIERLMS